MKNRLLAGALIALGAPFLATAACPAGVTPQTFLVGKTYAFRLSSANVGAIGTMTLFAGGYVSVVETVADLNANRLNLISRLAPASGRWVINNACTAGTAPDGSKSWIGIMLNRTYFSLDITALTATTLTLSGVDDSVGTAAVPVQHFALPGTPACPTGPGPCTWAPPALTNAISGTAQLLNPPVACPAGLGNPLNLIKNFKYRIPLGTNTVVVNALFNNPFAYSGDLLVDQFVGAVAPVPPFNPVTQAGPALGTVVPNYQTQGRYIIYNDCSGGELLLNNGRVLTDLSAQLDFVFSKPDFSEIFVIRDDFRLTNTTPPFTQFFGQVVVATGTKQ